MPFYYKKIKIKIKCCVGGLKRQAMETTNGSIRKETERQKCSRQSLEPHKQQYWDIPSLILAKPLKGHWKANSSNSSQASEKPSHRKANRTRDVLAIQYINYFFLSNQIKCKWTLKMSNNSALYACRRPVTYSHRAVQYSA
jgi:hypothetical protein